jgi:hypothetical protein
VRECRLISANLAVTTLVCLFQHSHARLRVRRAPGIPHALCFLGASFVAQLGRIAPRDCGGVFTVIARSEATKQSILLCRGTKHGLLRFARNDGRPWLFEN